MKNKILASLFIIPLLFSCNKKTNLGFDNPFPNDSYLEKRIGFKQSAEETPKRQLTPSEIANVILTKNDNAGLSLIDASITNKTGEIHSRHYDRAFAGQYKQGYDAHNEMVDTKLSVLTNEKLMIGKDKKTGPFRRTLSINYINRVLDYAYGQISKEQQTEDYLYFADKNKTNEVNYDNLANDAKYLSHRIQVKENETSISVVESAKPELEFDSSKTSEKIKEMANPYFAISQNKDFFDVFDPNNPNNSGADKDGNVILWVEKMTPDEITLKDGRRYKSSNNELTVSKSSLVTIEIETEDGKKEKKNRYLVNYARRYAETVITSDVIQPNIPPTFLQTPILISFTEEIYHFSIDPLKTNTREYGLLTSVLPTKSTQGVKA